MPTKSGRFSFFFEERNSRLRISEALFSCRNPPRNRRSAERKLGARPRKTMMPILVWVDVYNLSP